MKNLTLLLLIFYNAAYAQNGIGEAAIPNVPNDGFYNIKFDPEWVPYLNEGISNIRIVNTGEQEVPYLFQKEIRESYTQQFKQYEIVEKKQERSCCTTILLLNPDEAPINNINLTIRNAEVTKNATLLGSDDNETWYALKQHFNLSSINNTKATSEVKIIDFPLSNYTYYKLQIEDSTSAPINVLSAGYYEVNAKNGSYTALSSRLRQTDSAAIKKTYIYINFDERRLIDKLYLELEGQPYFLRRASLLTKTSRLDKKGDSIHFFEKLRDFTISSKQNSILELDNLSTNELQIIIENDDNPPLKVKQAEAYQLNRYLTAWLREDNVYKVHIGDKSMTAPIYDLSHFKESIASGIPSLKVGHLIVAAKDVPDTSVTYFTNKNIIWVAIILVIVIFGVMAIRLARETSKRGENEP